MDIKQRGLLNDLITNYREQCITLNRSEEVIENVAKTLGLSAQERADLVGELIDIRAKIVGARPPY
jgi:hypothetical protein